MARKRFKPWITEDCAFCFEGVALRAHPKFRKKVTVVPFGEPRSEAQEFTILSSTSSPPKCQDCLLSENLARAILHANQQGRARLKRWQRRA